MRNNLSPATRQLMGLSLIIVAIAWGFVPVFQKILLQQMTPVQVVFSRFLLSGICFLLLVLAKYYQQFLNILRYDFWLILLCTILGPLPAMVLTNYGLKHLPVSVAGVLSASELLFVYIFAVIARQETWSRPRMLSILLASLGVGMIVYDKTSLHITSFSFCLGVLVILVANIILALNTVISKKLIPQCSPFVFMAISFLLGSFCLIPFLGDNYITIICHLDAARWGALLFCALIATVISFSVWYLSLKVISPSTVSATLCLVPAVSFFAGVSFFDDAISLAKLFGLVLMLFGLYFLNRYGFYSPPLGA